MGGVGWGVDEGWKAQSRGLTALERSPINNLNTNETGRGGWGGRFHGQSFHALQYIMFTTMTTLQRDQQAPCSEPFPSLVVCG